jgi:hypothetical protein
MKMQLKEPECESMDSEYSIVTCRVVCVTKMTGSSLDDWIYQHFGYSLS